MAEYTQDQAKQMFEVIKNIAERGPQSMADLDNNLHLYAGMMYGITLLAKVIIDEIVEAPQEDQPS